MLHYPKAAQLCTKNRTKNEKEDVFFSSVQSERSVSGFICLSQQIWSRNEGENLFLNRWKETGKQRVEEGWGFPLFSPQLLRKRQQWAAVMWREEAVWASNVRTGEEILFVRKSEMSGAGGLLTAPRCTSCRARETWVTKKQQGFWLLTIFIKVTAHCFNDRHNHYLTK